MSWRTLRLDEIAHLQRGRFSARPRNDPKYYGGDVPFIQTGDVSTGRGLVARFSQTLNREGLTVSKLFPRGSLVMTIAANIGDVAEVDFDFACPDSLVVITPRDGIDKNWLRFAIEAKKPELDALAPQNAQKNLSLEALRPTEVKVPSLATQRCVAEAFMTWDAAIEKIEDLIAAKQQRFSGLIDQLLFRRSRVDAAFRLEPLHRIAERVQRQADGGTFPLLTISSASGFVRQEDKYSRYMAGESAKTYTLLRRGEFAYNKGNSLRYEFGCVFPLLDYDAALVPSVYVSFRLREGVHPAYLQHLFAANYLKPQLRAVVKTGVRNNGLLNIRPEEFMGTSVPLPSLALQQQIAAVLDEAREEIRLLALKLEALRIQKRGLMQKLLTGKWRVPIDEGVTA